jgi:hypothetical protein
MLLRGACSARSPRLSGLFKEGRRRRARTWGRGFAGSGSNCPPAPIPPPPLPSPPARRPQVWILDDYWTYAAFTLAASYASALLELREVQANLRELSDRACAGAGARPRMQDDELVVVLRPLPSPSASRRAAPPAGAGGGEGDGDGGESFARRSAAALGCFDVLRRPRSCCGEGGCCGRGCGGESPGGSGWAGLARLPRRRLAVGDVLLLSGAAAVPCDATLFSGALAADESDLTGAPRRPDAPASERSDRRRTDRPQRNAAQRSAATAGALIERTAQHKHNTAQHSTAQHSAAQHSAAQHSTVLHSTAQHSTAQHSTA